MLKFFKGSLDEPKDKLQNWNKTTPLFFFQFLQELTWETEYIGNAKFHFCVAVQNQLTLLD